MTISRRTALQTGAALALSPYSLALAQDAEKKEPKVPAVYADAVFDEQEPPSPRKGSFTIAVLPDTQNYSEKYPETYVAQTEWLVAQREARNIACVLHLGDVTNRNSHPEWKNALGAMNKLDGTLPYFMALGNHDYSPGGGCSDRTTLFNEYFPIGKFRERPTFGGVYDQEPERMENSYHLFSAGGREFVVFCLEFGPRKDVIRWANEVAAKQAKREAILVTHAYIYHDETRYDWKKYGAKQSWNPHAYAVAKATEDNVSDGEELWNNLVAKNENFILTLNGHVLGDGLGRVTTATPGGRDVPQLLVNFQMKPNGGDGWLRLLEFDADGVTVDAYDYSPVLKKSNVSPQNRFTLKIPRVKAV